MQQNIANLNIQTVYHNPPSIRRQDNKEFDNKKELKGD